MPSRLAVITFLNEEGDGPVYPGHDLPGRPAYPSHGLPSGGYPSHGLPPPGQIATLPVFPFDPTRPDAGLPSEPGGPSTQPIRPGAKFVVKWLACHGLILVPDNSLPDTGSDVAEPR